MVRSTTALKGAVLLVLVTGMVSTGAGLVMNANPDQLPPGCDEIRGWENITVEAGHDHAEHPGTVFTYDDRNYQFDPCTRVTVTFVNDDSVRHQWMVHGLPKSIHDMGMFTLEVTGPGNETGTFITPSYEETLLVHCGVPQHEQKGMKAQLKVGTGDGNIPNIPGVTGAFDAYEYPRESPVRPGMILGLAGLVIGAGAAVMIWLFGD
jgi:hypothetical protein